MDRRTYDEWQERGDGAVDWATTEAQRILENHQPERLDAALSDELQKIIGAIDID
jgi:trimethylamine:corrinoid methyltransferase-like protein